MHSVRGHSQTVERDSARTRASQSTSGNKNAIDMVIVINIFALNVATNCTLAGIGNDRKTQSLHYGTSRCKLRVFTDLALMGAPVI